jgi:hypothetical protein
MKSLQPLSIAKTRELQNLTLAEVVERCRDDSGFCNALFSSREALLAFFDGYMKGDVNIREVERLNYSDIFKSMLLKRDDVNSSSELKDWFTALARGFVWEYKMDPSINWVAVPKFSDARGSIFEIKLYGTLPCEDCIGVQFDTYVSYRPARYRDEQRRPTGIMLSNFIIRSDREVDVRFDQTYKTLMYTELCKDINDKLRRINFGFRKEIFKGTRLVVNIEDIMVLRVRLTNEDFWPLVVEALLASNLDFLQEDMQHPDVLEVKVYPGNTEEDREGDLIFTTKTTVAPFRF